MYCIGCGKEINEGAKFCTECGTRVPIDYKGAVVYDCGHMEPTEDPVENRVEKAPYNALCVAGPVLSCISLFLNFLGIVAIIGTVLSVVGLVNCQKNNENGKAAAITGIVIGGLSIIYTFIVLVANLI